MQRELLQQVRVIVFAGVPYAAIRSCDARALYCVRAQWLQIFPPAGPVRRNKLAPPPISVHSGCSRTTPAP